MKHIKTIVAVMALMGVAGTTAEAQVTRRQDRTKKDDQQTAGVTMRMKGFYEENPVSESSKMWERIIYRQIDLNKPANMALYYPEEPTENQESLFRIILRLVTNGQVPAYEYLDGRELFTEQYKIKVGEMLDRFNILYTQAKGSTEKNPKYQIEESDVPSNEVLSYYAIEKWEFNSIDNKTTTSVDAICPVLHRIDDYGGEPIKYPMFWVKLADLRPYLTQQSIFVDDDNNLAKYNYDDYFQLCMYEGEIYKTRNLKNQTLMQQFPDPDDLKVAQDSIENRLESFDKHIWVPTREELEARRAAEEEARLRAEGKSDDIVVKEREVNLDEGDEEEVSEPRNARSVRQKKEDKKKDEKKEKKKKAKKPKNDNSGAVRSVRRTR